jgi:putative tributyrin esterase
MSTLFLQYSSAVLGKETTASILFPDAGSGPFPVLYLFHGLRDDSSTWLRKTRLEVYAAKLPMLIVMPDG